MDSLPIIKSEILYVRQVGNNYYYTIRIIFELLNIKTVKLLTVLVENSSAIFIK